MVYYDEVKIRVKTGGARLEPLFENEITIDAGVLEEWQKKELTTHYRMVYGLFIALMVLSLVFAGTAVSIAVSVGMALSWVLAGLFVVMFGVLLWATLTMPRRMVRMALKKDKDSGIPYRSAVTVFEEEVLVQRNRPEAQADVATAAACLAKASVLQGELTALMAEAETVDQEDEVQMARLRGQLEALREQMDALNSAVPRAEGEARCQFGELTDYMRTKSLHGLFFGEMIVLLGKDSFIQGENSAFEAFVRGRLEAAAKTAKEDATQKNLAKALARYWPEE